ncbi:VOC family protein [Sphingopyxis witflariensis]|uniref:Glyoxalase n=1 Tax=Sphingopyxis witflariensis TaxID=173675 RepID=A0A246JTY4_9SPHN|nr:VOC family protein [Sphingopyxis witflariensis]OWQ96515.1 glyoxalase [Sphingopyxis witflariensis]
MAIRALGYVVIKTTQADIWDTYLTEVVGVMRAADPADGAAHYRIDDRPFRFRIEAGEQDELTAAAFELSDEAAFQAMAAAIAAAGRPVEMGSADEAVVRGVQAFFRTSDPTGNGLEFFHGDSRDDVAFVSPVGVKGFVTGDMGMGHAVFAAPDFDETHRFYTDVVGFHDTDIPRFHFSPDPNDPGMGFAFMHADNGRHHSVAIGQVPVPPSRCVHLMLEMQDLRDVGRCYDRMRVGKVTESASLGTHTNDQMTSFYMQTPAGFDLEIGCDPLIIDPASWTPTAHQVVSEWGHVWAWQKAMEEAAQ